VKPTIELFAPAASSVMTCPVAGFGIVRAGAEQIASLRRNPVPPPGKPLAVGLLKHADDQTVVGISAVYRALHNHHLAGVDFTNWGVVAAPSFLGRAMLIQTLKRFGLEGAWGVSPHLIPHHSVHAVSGTISQALRIVGPNFGIGGGPGAVVEAVTVAATLMADRNLPGLWLVLTEYEPEFVPQHPDGPSVNGHHTDPCAVALALALVPAAAASMGISLRVCPHEPFPDLDADQWMSWPPLNTVSALAAAFSQNHASHGNWRFGLSGWLELTSLELASAEPMTSTETGVETTR
jgi:hypothetical protein